MTAQIALQDLYRLSHDVWVPAWFDLFSDPLGGFHERLDRDGLPIDMPRRLVTQCRQVMVYAMHGDPLYRTKLDDTFRYIQETYVVPETGIPVFSVADRYYDLYALAFLLSACAAHGTDASMALAARVTDFIQAHFRAGTGFHESLDLSLVPKNVQRRQNPHMHLLEAAISLMAVSDDPQYRALADTCIRLFFDHFFDGKNIFEFFDADLENPAPAIEAGHHAEWVWLLERYRLATSSTDPRIPQAQKALWHWVGAHGIDRDHGGVFNIQEPGGTIVDAGKRIWPQMETLRAAVIMRDDACIQDIASVLERSYLKADGLWTESLNRDLSPASDFLPGTTPYHIYPVLKEIAGS